MLVLKLDGWMGVKADLRIDYCKKNYATQWKDMLTEIGLTEKLIEVKN